jgi:hypothetical protein
LRQLSQRSVSRIAWGRCLCLPNIDNMHNGLTANKTIERAAGLDGKGLR